MNILEELGATAKERVAAAKKNRPLTALRYDAESLPTGNFAFEQAIRQAPDIAFICECKKASPSKGVISPDFPYLDIARSYAAAGAECISVLTEPTRFLGQDRYLQEIAAAVNVPCLRKDFTVDEYMVYEAKILGAAAVLLIVSLIRDRGRLKEYVDIADNIGLSALVETHDAAEIETALAAGARIIGVNNRNLHNFTVDTGNSLRLRQEVPTNVLFVAESGIVTAADVEAARQAGADAVLVGESLMRAGDIGAKLAYLKNGG